MKKKFLESDLATGLVGVFFSFFYMAFYAWYKAKVQHQGGPAVENALSFLPFKTPFINISRDYYDIWMILFATVISMVGWDRFKYIQKHRLIFSIFSLVMLTITAYVGLGKLKFFTAPTTSFMSFSWTNFEIPVIIYIFISLAFFILYAWKKYSSLLNKGDIRRAAYSAFHRWLAIFSVISLFLWFTYGHPYFSGSNWNNWKISTAYLWFIVLSVGYPYIFFTVLLRHHRFGEERRDSGLIFISTFRSFVSSLNKKSFRPLYLRTKNRNWRITIFDFFVKAFFLPIMLSDIFLEGGNFFRNIPRVIINYTQNTLSSEALFNITYDFLLHSVFFIDVIIGIIGYSMASRWLHNKVRSVDLTAGGWAIVLICYPPYNSASGSVFPFKAHLAGEVPSIFTDPSVLLTLKIIVLFFFSIYTLATVSFGLRFSNLTNRGIITNGPYAIVRHPAYISKALGWWALHIIAFTNIWNYIALLAWNGVYFLRAMTEERHLRKDPEYLEYCKRVKWRFIPGIF
jgi:protein-S-isoprenylcysteine O-methyltransferase Ste14